jgi:hypothetical protein
MSTYGATVMPLPAGGGGAGGVGVVFDGVGFGAGAEDFVGLGATVTGLLGVGWEPPAHGVPLIVQDVGAPLPATMKPKLVAAPAATAAL